MFLDVQVAHKTLHRIIGQMTLFTALTKTWWIKLKNILVIKLNDGQTLQSLFTMVVSILLTSEQVSMNFDVVDGNIPLSPGKNIIKQRNWATSTSNDNASLVVSDKLKEVELYTYAGRHWCINIQPCFPVNKVSVILEKAGERNGWWKTPPPVFSPTICIFKESII